MAEYGDKPFVVIADRNLSYVKGLQAQIHWSLPAVGMPMSFTQRTLPDPMSGQEWGYWLDGSNGRGIRHDFVQRKPSPAGHGNYLVKRVLSSTEKHCPNGI